MPPKKLATASLATKPTSDDNKATGMILEYLVQQNRPYSATEISANLHNAVTKTRTDKLLKEMFERKEIGGRASGKQWVYWPLQDPNASCSTEELAAYDEEIARIRDNLPNRKAELKAKTAILATIRSAPSTDALRVSLTSMQAAKAQLEARLGPLRSGSVKPVSAKEKEHVERENKFWCAVRNKRKRIFNDLEATLLESGAVTKDDLWVRLRTTAPEL